VKVELSEIAYYRGGYCALGLKHQTDQMTQYLHEILTLLGPDTKRLPRLLVLFLAVSMLDLAGIALIGPYVAIVADLQLAGGAIEKISAWIDLPTSQESLLIVMSFALLGVFLVKAVSAIWINYIIIKFSVDQQIRLRSLLMWAYQTLPYTDYLRRNSSEYIHSTQTLVNHYANGVVTSGMRTLSDGIVASVILVMLALINPVALMLLLGLLGIVVFSYDRLFRKNIRHIGEQSNLAATSMVQGIHEGIEGLKEIRVLGHERYFHHQVHDGALKYGRYYTRSTIISAAPRYLLELIMVFFVVLLVLLTLTLQQNLQQLLPTLSMFGLAAIRLLPAANVFSSSLTQLRFNRDSVSRLYQDVTSMHSVEEDGGEKNLATYESFKRLSISNISFRYPAAEQDALSQIILDVHAGESIGLIGSSGSGKTTLVDTLLGLLEPQQGEITFNGIPLNKSLATWRSHVAYLPQQVFLIDNSLRRNVALGIEDKDIDEKQLIGALDKARLSELVVQLHEGVDTILGERGVRLSGGQRQRVALARAFYHERDILIMDEATSALDNETEREIVEEIKRLKGKKTMIVIAHRLTTVQHCDRIYKMEKGKVVASGTPQEILGIN